MAHQIPASAARRRLICAAWSLALSPALLQAQPGPAQPARFKAYPFALGVASGCPRPDGIVLWTRLAPAPLDGGGMGPAPVPVRWELAEDEAFVRIVRKGESLATPTFAHSVHIELRGLRPDRYYWYRFLAGDASSPVGRTRTAPSLGAQVDRLRFAFASCQQFEQGYYAAYRHMAAEDVDLVVFLGDYIYESTWGRQHVRKHGSPEPTDLAGYRNRHALYRTDPDLQRMHALVPWLLTWDDHEVANDYAAGQGQHLEPDFLLRRAAAYRAYYEHMPLEKSMAPRDEEMRIYDTFGFGGLAQFHMLDDRQYRDVQVCPPPNRGGGSSVVGADACPERLDPSRSLLGWAQERWLQGQLDRSTARWNILGQQSILAQIDQAVGPAVSHWTDAWDGYPAARRRLLDFIAARKPGNPLVIGGDLHCHYVCDIKHDFDDLASPVLATEVCGTSISSQGWPQSRVLSLLPDNPHVRFADSQRRGYVVMELSRSQCVATLRGVEDEKRRDSGIATQARFVVEDGRPGALPA